MVGLVIAGEAVFLLPFVVVRVFRPTLLEVFGITNLELGTAFSVYGVVAMVSYFPGGPVADRFSARKLMALALVLTASGGVFYASIPDAESLKFVFGFWGVSTILLFWAAMIRATREWGGDGKQGAAFGILDAGRGLYAALLGSATVVMFSMFMPADVQAATLEQKSEALQVVILVFAGMTGLAALLVVVAIPNAKPTRSAEPAAKATISGILEVLRNPAVWLQALIIVTAYTGYKGIDDFGMYASDVFGFDDVESAHVSTLALWVRPFAALGAGLLGDRLGGTRTILACFGIMIAGNSVIAFGVLDPTLPWMLFATVIATCAAAYGVRGLYFAIFGEANVPANFTGTAAGLVSVVGYTPDVFMGPLQGALLDTYPGNQGHEYFFASLAVFAALGFVCTVLFHLLVKRRSAV